MQKADSPRGRLWYVLPFLIVLLVVTADQLSKTWIRAYPDRYELGFVRLTPVHNTGSAFGLFQGQSFILTIVVAVGIAFILLAAFLIYRRFPLLVNAPNKIAFGLILGGAIGNLVDRLRFGQVTDFIDVGFWPVFNVADSAITVAAIIIAYSLLRLTRAEKTDSSDE